MRSDNKIWNLDNNPMKLNLNYWIKTDKNDEKIIKYINNKNSMPFSCGKRSCIGQSLANKECQAFLATLLLKFKIIAKNNDPNNIKLQFNDEGVSTLKKQIPVFVCKRNK